MEAAVITASASIVVAVLVFALNQWSQATQQQHQARLTRINTQLRELYGPLHALLDVNERVWSALRHTHLPPRDERLPAGKLPRDAAKSWRLWLDHALMPANIQMRDIIIQHADLLIEQDVPQPLREFCAHVTSYEALLSNGKGNDRPLIEHPGGSYVDYVRTSFARLKQDQARLLEDRWWGFTVRRGFTRSP